jgi:hypothetical protein
MGTGVDRVSQGAGLEAGVFVSDARECERGEHVRNGVVATRTGPLPESGSLPSARRFAECFLSGTRQISLCRVPHSAKSCSR